MQEDKEHKGFWDTVQQTPALEERRKRLRADMERLVVQPAIAEQERQRRGAARIRKLPLN